MQEYVLAEGPIHPQPCALHKEEMGLMRHADATSDYGLRPIEAWGHLSLGAMPQATVNRGLRPRTNLGKLQFVALQSDMIAKIRIVAIHDGRRN